MSNASDLERIDEENVYDFTRIGSFGRFKTGESFPVEFVMTTFTPAELNANLTFARDIETAYLDFELLMQRDIDEERVRDEVEPYLNRSHLEGPERRGIVFFPPLLAAIVPVEFEKMLPYYSMESVYQIGTGRKLVVREWEPFFQLRYMTSKSPDALVVGSGSNSFRVDRNQVELSIRIAIGDQRGAKLVVIDGQHRLMALRRVFKNARAQLKELLVPVCIVFPPSCSKEEAGNGGVNIPNVPQVFRALFVDVNETVEKVGGHFTILLRENTIPSLAVRRFCDITLKLDGKMGLAAIEWNIRTRKNSEELNRPYSLTSIGLLSKALTTLFDKEDARLFYALNLAEVDARLHPEDQDPQEYPKNIKWDAFSPAQKPAIEEQIDKYLVPGLRRIFSEVEAHAGKKAILDEQLTKLQLDADDPTPGTDTPSVARMVLKNVLDYKPIVGDDDDVPKAEKARVTFNKAVVMAKEARCAPIIDRALFQRSIVDVWGVLIDQTRDMEIPLEKSVDVLVYLLNRALLGKGRTFEYSKLYMQNSVFIGSRIKANEKTRIALGTLIEAHFGNPDVAKEAASILCKGTGLAIADIADQLKARGIDSAGNFGRHLQVQSVTAFVKSYSVNSALDLDRRRELEEAEKMHKAEYAEYKAGQRGKDEVSQAFREMVLAEVAKDVDLAMQELKKSLGLDVDVLVTEDDVSEDEQE